MPALAVGGSAAKADFKASRMISHLLGFVMSARSGFISQSAELVVGGRLQFMLPLRSITKRRLAGRRSALMVVDAQPDASLGPRPLSPGVTMIPVPASPPVPPDVPPVPPPPLPLPPAPPSPP